MGFLPSRPIEKVLPLILVALGLVRTSCSMRIMRMAWDVLERLKKDSLSVVIEGRAGIIRRQKGSCSGKQVCGFQVWLCHWYESTSFIAVFFHLYFCLWALKTQVSKKIVSPSDYYYNRFSSRMQLLCNKHSIGWRGNKKVTQF